ncbi:MAG: AbrB/MazE/SpoVT family DNA-binding domain-containing protein [Gemmatimonadales bacterium]
MKKLTRVGNSLGLVIDRAVLDLVGIDRDTPLELRTYGRVIMIQPASGASLERVRARAATVIKAHRATLKKLASG